MGDHVNAFEVEELIASCQARLTALAGQGVVMQGLSDHWIESLLLQLLDGEQLHQAKVAHFRWLAERLDEAEPQIRQQRILAGLAVDNAGGKRR